MMYTFSEACQIVDAQYRRTWGYPYEGTFMVAKWGYEDAKHYVVIVGSMEWLIYRNQAFFPPADDRCIMVRKDTGRVKEINPVLIQDKLKAMTPVGTGHPMEDE